MGGELDRQDAAKIPPFLPVLPETLTRNRVKRSEDQEQIALVQLLHSAATTECWFHVGNNPRSARDGARLKRLGCKAGVPDLVFIKGGIFFALEMKAIGGRVSPAQDDFHEIIKDAGGYVAVAYGFDHAVAILVAWGLIKRGAVQ